MPNRSTSLYTVQCHPFVQAAIWNIPWAIGVASTVVYPHSFVDLIETTRSVFFLYTPDATLPYVSPIEVTFPAYESAGWASGDFTTASKDIPIQKIVSSDLATVAPEVDLLIRSFDLTSAELNKLLSGATSTTGSFRLGACDWLNQHPDVA